MLQEIKFENNKPYKIDVLELRGEEMHFHDEAAEFIFVIKGQIYIKGNYPDVKRRCGTGILFAPKESHSIISDEPSIIAKIYYNPEHFDFYKIRHIINAPIDFDLDTDIKYAYELINLIVRILLIEYKDTKESNAIIYKLLNESYQMVLNCLPQHIIHKNNKSQITQDILERYNRISDYILANYKEAIQLSEIAEKECISVTRLSHFWKDITGISIQNTINLYRVFKAGELLISSDYSLEKISAMCGFSHMKYFYKYFKEKFKISPKEYRNQYLAMLQHSKNTFENRILSKNEAEKYIDQYIPYYYKSNNELPENSLPYEEVVKEKALSDIFNIIQQNKADAIPEADGKELVIGTIPLVENKGIYSINGEYKINWEYMYIAIQYILDCGLDAVIIINYEIMEESAWLDIITRFQEEVNRIWGEKLRTPFKCDILIKKFDSYKEAQNLIQSLKEKSMIFDQIELRYSL